MARTSPRSGSARQSLLCQIEKLSHEGRGIAHHDGKVVFIAGALPGETVKAKIIRSRSAYIEAVTEEVLEVSDSRVEPPCRHFHRCGGCSLQHLRDTAQQSFKEEVLHEKLSHAQAHANYRHLPMLTGATSAYRRKARLAVRYVHSKERVLIGFREQGSNFITDMDSCEILDPAAARHFQALAKLIGSMQARESIPQIEVAVGDDLPGKSSLALVFRHLHSLTKGDLELLVNFASQHSIQLYLQPKGPETVHLLHPDAVEERLYYTLPDYGLELAFHPLDFTQVNAGMNKMMIRQALELLNIQKSDQVLDLFCGLGNFTLPLGTRAKRVCGIEGVADMVRRGQENATRNHLDNVSFHCADLSSDAGRREWLQEGFNKVLLDPPRSGAIEMIPVLTEIRPECIVYVSCNPSTLSRDAELLGREGYRLTVAGAMDMFPHTSHVEAMALFEDSHK